MIRFPCRCGKLLQASEEYAGRDAVCPECGHRQPVPTLGGETPAEVVRADDRPGAVQRGRRPPLRDEGGDSGGRPPAETSGKATASLILGLLSLLFSCLTGIPALILGILALRDIERTRGRLGGRGLAIAGISTGLALTVLSVPALIGVLLLSVQKVREAATRVQSQNNLKQIGLAMHNYHDVHQHFPPAAVVGPKGGGGLSWRVHLLPYLGEDNLFKQFHLDEPWDSEHNKTLLARMPKVYLYPGDNPMVGQTYYQVFTGPQTVFDPQAPRGGVRITDIIDGVSNTAMAAEAAVAVPWTKPDDLAFDPAGPLPRLGARSGKYLILMADGAVRVVAADTPEATLRAVITRNGGENVSLP